MRVACCAILAALAGLGVGGCSHIYRVPSSSMEPTLHCAKPGPLCRGKQDDRVVTRPVKPGALRRGDIVVFETPSKAEQLCGSAGTYIKRVIGLPGETVREDDAGFIHVDGRRLREPYIPAATRWQDVELLRRFSDRAQFVVITHQKRTMEAADVLYGVTMGGDGISQIVSRRVPRDEAAALGVA